jgi:penicillin G amidase
MEWKDAYLYPVLGSILKPAITLAGKALLPTVRGSMRLAGLASAVEVLRDRWYVPHIFARSVVDLVFAQGFTHAQERLWQMDFNRRVVAGRLAEVLGAPGLAPDRVMRTLGLRRVAEEEAALADADIGRLLISYCAGVNAGIEQARGRSRLPLEFRLLGYTPEPWQMADVLGMAKLMDWILAANWSSEFMRGQITQRIGAQKAARLGIAPGDAWAAIMDAAGIAGLNPTRAVAGAQAGEGVGSNNWVVHGERTASGKPLLAGDMHLSLTAPAVWFENHLACPDFELSGISLPGVPFIVAGHNRHVAWSFTDGMNDVQDLYEEHLQADTDGKCLFEFQGAWYPAEVRHEVIKVKGAPDTIEEVICTRHGPLVNVLFKDAFPAAPPLALRWTALEPETTMTAIAAMTSARDTTQFHQALEHFTGPGQNTVYADTQGNIGFTLTGKTPVRARGDGSVPVPGWTGEYEWLGYIPFEEMPHLANPPRGYVVTANNVHLRGDEPFIARDYCEADRAARITELIEARPKVDVAYTRKMHYDQVSLSGRRLAACLGALQVPSADMAEVAARMRAWDGLLTPDSTLAAIYEVTLRNAIRLMLAAHLGEELGLQAMGKGSAAGYYPNHSREWFIQLLLTPTSEWFDLGQRQTRDDVLRLALRQALDELTPPRPWGQIHRLTFNHILGEQKLLRPLLNVGPYPVGGDGNTINAAWVSLTDLAKPHFGGPPFRFIADLGDLDHCLGMLAPGQSGHPASPHYRDGVQAWFKGAYHPMLVRRAEIEQNLLARLSLQAG